MKKVCDKKGFTLAELLIVMAIILILAAIAIPNFTQQLERSRETADINAIRAAYSEAMTEHMLQNSDEPTVKVKLVQTKSGWNYIIPTGQTGSNTDVPFTCNYATSSNAAPGEITLKFTFDASENCTVALSS